MSFGGFSLTDFQGDLNRLVSIQSSSPQRNIGGIIPNCTIEEEGLDELTITQHPVEVGAAVTDHAYKQPSSLTMRVMWSNSDVAAGFDPNYVTDIYNQLRALQVSGETFTITTGKRQYTSMLMTSLQQTTDEKTELSLDIVAQFQEIIIVQTTTTSVPPIQNQAQPQQTAAIQDAGVQQLIPAIVPTLGH